MIEGLLAHVNKSLLISTDMHNEILEVFNEEARHHYELVLSNAREVRDRFVKSRFYLR